MPNGKDVPFMKIRCNGCGLVFKNESELTKILVTYHEDGTETYAKYFPNTPINDETQAVIDGCPNCLTDSMLMDIP